MDDKNYIAEFRKDKNFKVLDSHLEDQYYLNGPTLSALDHYTWAVVKEQPPIKYKNARKWYLNVQLNKTDTPISKDEMKNAEELFVNMGFVTNDAMKELMVTDKGIQEFLNFLFEKEKEKHDKTNPNLKSSGAQEGVVDLLTQTLKELNADRAKVEEELALELAKDKEERALERAKDKEEWQKGLEQMAETTKTLKYMVMSHGLITLGEAAVKIKDYERRPPKD